MIINGQYVEVEEVSSVVPIGNMNGCRVTFKNGNRETLRCYAELMNELERREAASD